MRDLVQKHFPDSTEHTVYKVVITSENGEKFEAEASDLDIEEILEFLT